jgi:hypothetical protein
VFSSLTVSASSLLMAIHAIASGVRANDAANPSAAALLDPILVFSHLISLRGVTKSFLASLTPSSPSVQQGKRKFFNLSKEDDVRKYVIRREVKSQKKENAKPYLKA